jgi:hypothetical protein
MSTAQRQAPASQARLNPSRVRLFRAQPYDVGTPHEEEWTVEDLEDIVRNHRLVCVGEDALYRPLIVRGHVRPSPDGSHTTILAHGVVEQLWRENDELWGKFAELSPEVLALVEGGYLRGLSVELYHDPAEANIPPHLARGASGPMLRRVSMLGGHLPRSKGLWVAGERADDGSVYATKPGWCCGETTMSDDQDRLREVAEKAGFGASFLDSLDDGQLGLMIADLHDRVLSGGQSSDTGTPDDTTGADTGADDMPAPSREQMVSDLVAAGQDQAALEQMDDAALTELWKQLQGQGGGTSAAPSTYGERDQRRGKQAPRVQVIQLSPHALRQLVRAEARAEGARAARPSRQRQVSEFCEKMVAAGKLSPAQADPANGPTYKLLTQTSSLSRFGEGKSDLELLMEEIEARPAVRTYGERLADGPGGAVGGTGDAAFEAKVQKHYEAHKERLDRLDRR